MHHGMSIIECNDHTKVCLCHFYVYNKMMDIYLSLKNNLIPCLGRYAINSVIYTHTTLPWLIHTLPFLSVTSSIFVATRTRRYVYNVMIYITHIHNTVFLLTRILDNPTQRYVYVILMYITRWWKCEHFDLFAPQVCA